MGVLVSLIDMGDGTCRVILDDVRSDLPQRETSWQFDYFYTHKRLASGSSTTWHFPSASIRDLGKLSWHDF
jgi:hypothetical protein